MILANKAERDNKLWSSSGVNQVKPFAAPRGTKVTFSTSSWDFKTEPVIACPTSWYAIKRLFFVSSNGVPAIPPIILSAASFTSFLLILDFFVSSC